MKKILYILIIIALFCVSCDEFLDQKPSKSSKLEPTTTEHLDLLLNKYRDLAVIESFEVQCCSDDFELVKGIFDGNPANYSMDKILHATWDTEKIPETNIKYWIQLYKNIFIANQILINLDRVSGTVTEKSRLRAEAHFIRALNYFELAGVYCLPYCAENKNELGLPLKNSTSFEESAKRATLEETYEFIKEDLKEALKLNQGIEQANGMDRTWRATTLGVKAFAARFYLSLSDYEKAKNFADIALSGKSDLIDYNTERYIADTIYYTVGDEQIGMARPNTLPQGHYPTSLLEHKEFYYFRYLSDPNWYFTPSQGLIDAYDHENDLRDKYHMVEHYSFFKHCTSNGFDYPSYIYYEDSYIPCGPSVPEMILIKAECQARLGQWEQGIQTVNILRAKRMDNTAPDNIINLSASSQNDAILKIIKERRRELAFVSRWYDLRRYNNNETSIDDVTITRHFYKHNGSSVLVGEGMTTYTLPPKSRLYARPISLNDIIPTEGVLEQNTY